jgi:hypothetical protein
MTIDTDRETFRERALASRRLIKNGDSEAANTETAAVEALAEQWHAKGRLDEFLVPLTGEAEKGWVRYSAASYLLAKGFADVAVPVLEEVQAGKGLASLGAERLLATWRKSNA